MKTLGWSLLIISCLTISPSWADEDEEKTITGTVTGIDWVSATICVRHTIPFRDNMDEISLKVTRNAVISRGVRKISLLDIQVQDQVSVVYYDDGLSGIKVKRLTDLNLAPS